jgi:hypothetical protein
VWRVEGQYYYIFAASRHEERWKHLALQEAEGHNFALSPDRPERVGHLDLSMTETLELESELARLKQEHRDLDMAIEALERMVAGDQLQIQRLKKRKLGLKDQIIQLEDQLTPDIIA